MSYPSTEIEILMPAEDFFRQLEKQRTQALVDRHMDIAELLHAHDYELISPSARVFSRNEYLGAIAKEPFYASWVHGPIQVQRSQGMAIVRYVARIVFPSGKVVDCWHTDSYALRLGQWQAVWSQATAIPTAAASSPT